MAPLSHRDFLALRRFEVLDGLRGISVILVFTAHPANPQFWPLLHGGAGVTVFFALSGFLITTLLLRERERHGRVDLGGFYLRRLFRIYPVYLLVLLCYVVLVLVVGMAAQRRDGFVENLPYFLLFFPEHAIAFNDWGYPIPFLFSWSIGIEEKFYFVWPVLGFALMATMRRARLIAIVTLAALFTAASFLGGTPAVLLAPYSAIAFGAIAAILLHDPRGYRVLSRLGRPLPLAAVAAVAICMQFGTGLIELGRPLYSVYAAVIAVLLCGLVTTRSSGVGWLASRPMVYVGALSYVLYLIHNLGLNAAEAVVPREWGFPGSLLSTALGIGLAFAAAAAIHRWYEEPLRLIGSRLSARRRERRLAVAA